MQVRAHELSLVQEISENLTLFSTHVKPLIGIANIDAKEAFIGQIIESIRRVKYVTTISDRPASFNCADPTSVYFDPIKAAILKRNSNEFEEACWLVFLAIHCGKNLRTGWRLVGELYGGINGSQIWSWNRIHSKVGSYKTWLEANYNQIHGKFGNHRKYETINVFKNNNTAEIIQSYVDWVGTSHVALFDRINQQSEFNAKKNFEILYSSMNRVTRFGRTAKFDYLTMLGKLKLGNLEPNSTYMNEATGPARGASLLFSGTTRLIQSRKNLEQWTQELDQALGLYFGLQVLEDALCNWQKSPTKFKAFRG